MQCDGAAFSSDVASPIQDAEGKYEVLSKYARDLTEEARSGKLVRHQYIGCF